MFMQILSDFFITLCKSIVSFMFMLYANKSSKLLVTKNINGYFFVALLILNST